MLGDSGISITNRVDFDNSSDPMAAGSLSSGSNFGNDDPASPGNPAAGSDDPNTGRGRTPVAKELDGGGGEAASEAAGNDAADEAARIADLRAILPGGADASIEYLREVLRDNDRASENSRRSANDEAVARIAAEAREEPAQATSPSSGLPSLSGSGSRRRSHRRSWQPCQPAPSRPGIVRVGGPIETGRSYNIGVTDEMDLDVKRIEAVFQVEDALNEKLGYNLRESGKYEEMEREYQEGERMLASTGLTRRRKKVLPAMKMWDAPPVSRMSLSIKEPILPEMGEPLPLPLSFGGNDEGMHNGGNGEICLGKFVDPGPNRDEDEEKREEFSVDNESWAGVSVDTSPMGPYEHAVRCWKCRAGLKVHIEVGLVACPRCRTISPATEVASIG